MEAVIDEACRTSRRVSSGIEPEVLKGELNASFKVKDEDVNAREAADESGKDGKKAAVKRAKKGAKGKAAKKRKTA